MGHFEESALWNLFVQLRGTFSGSDRFRGMEKPLAPHREAASGLTPALERNINALVQRRKREQSEASLQQKIADGVTTFTGSMLFVYLHLLVFGFWIAANARWVPAIPPWDESFVVLAMIASVEAIFLSTFVLISQNRMAAEADRRAELDLQISLLTEHEITKVVVLLNEMAPKMGIDPQQNEEFQEAASDIAPERVLDKIEDAKG